MTPNLPWEIQEARDALAAASRAQQKHSEVIRDAVRAAARADHLHRVAIAVKVAELREAGFPAALCSKMAQGDVAVSVLGEEAARLEGDREIAVQEGWRLHANRKDTQQLAEWSQRKDLAVDFGDHEPEHYENVTPPRVA
jgi:hypothetical protein